MSEPKWMLEPVPDDELVRLSLSLITRGSDHLDPETALRLVVEIQAWRATGFACEACGKPRSKADGGATFTVCDECWDEAYRAVNLPVGEP